MRVRTYKISDIEAILELFYGTVHHVNIRDYNQEQVDAWAPANINLQFWQDRLSSTFTYVAEEGDKIIGFGNLEDNGHIDCFYCHQDFQRQGVGSQILENIELKARELRIKRLSTAASITAKPFFIGKKFIVVCQQQVELRGQVFINFLMEKFIV
jgi:GNAT superfamily N-acetyltransferase